jgi:hypothetical protein
MTAPNKTAGANAGRIGPLPMRTHWAASLSFDVGQINNLNAKRATPGNRPNLLQVMHCAHLSTLPGMT